MCEHAFVVLLDGFVELAGDLRQTGAVYDRDRSPRGVKDLCHLQATNEKRHRRSPNAKGDSQIVMCEVDAVGATPIECGEKPSRHPLLI